MAKDMWWYTADWQKTFRLWAWNGSIWQELIKCWIWDGSAWQLFYDATVLAVDHILISPANAGTLSTSTPNAQHFVATAYDVNNRVVTGTTFTWTCDSVLDSNPATIDSDGNLSTGDPETNRHVEATADGKTGLATYSVA